MIIPTNLLPKEILSRMTDEMIIKRDEAVRLFNATYRFASSKFNLTPREILEERENICHSCDQWDSQAINGTGRCKKCGCSTWAKLRMATERCPLGKWEAVSAEDSKQ